MFEETFREYSEGWMRCFTDSKKESLLSQEDLQKELVVIFLDGIEPRILGGPLKELAKREDAVKKDLIEAVERCRVKALRLDEDGLKNEKAAQGGRNCSGTRSSGSGTGSNSGGGDANVGKVQTA